MSGRWYPGHMASSLRAMRENARLVDVIIEVVDARAPTISRDPSIAKVSSRPRLIAMAKADLAEEDTTRRWIERFRKEGTPAYRVNARTGEGVPALLGGCRVHLGERAKRVVTAGKERALRAMVVGVPNVGKSSLINRMTQGGSARTGALPGVTRGKQWIRTAEGIEVLDLPGVLKPRNLPDRDMFKLAVLGIIPRECYDPYYMAVEAVRFLSSEKPHLLAAMGVDDAGRAGEDLIGELGNRKGFLARGGEVDLARTATWLLGQLREGKAGRLSLEEP